MVQAWDDTKVKPHVRKVAELIRDNFGMRNIGGWGLRDNVSDHPLGLALDVMTYKGQPVADWAVANARSLNVTYVIWNRKIWSTARAKEGWRRYSGPSPHTDHVHISFLAKPTSNVLQAGFNFPDIPDPLNPFDDGLGGFLIPGPLDDLPGMPDNPLDAIRDVKNSVDKITEVLKWIADPHNWYRVGLFVGGIVALLLAFRGLASGAKSAAGSVKSSVGNAIVKAGAK